MYKPDDWAAYNIEQLIRTLRNSGIKPEIIRKALTDAAEGLV